MAKKGFQLSTHPCAYQAQFLGEGNWKESFPTKHHLTPEAESRLSEADLEALLTERACFPGIPLVTYTSQYGLGCFEGMKALPQKDGSMKLFRPDQNAQRFYSSMQGLRMPPLPTDRFIAAVKWVVNQNNQLGYCPRYNPEWEKDDFLTADAVYLRPFSYSEAAVGLGVPKHPYVFVVSTTVGSYFKPGNTKACTTDRTRATPHGTGWIKCDANYVIPILAKKEAEDEGYMEVIFLDPIEHRYVEEGSSCNIFFVMKDGTLVTPELGDTILPGITRKSIIQLAKDKGYRVEERKISIDEVLADTKESFVTGTAAGIGHFESITHKGKTVRYSNGEMTPVAKELLIELKGIQYGVIEDRHHWMVDVAT